MIYYDCRAGFRINHVYNKRYDELTCQICRSRPPAVCTRFYHERWSHIVYPSMHHFSRSPEKTLPYSGIGTGYGAQRCIDAGAGDVLKRRTVIRGICRPAARRGWK